MSLNSILWRLLPWARPTRTVDLDPRHQRILRALLQFGELDFARLQAEVSAEHSVSPGETLLALVRLEDDGVVTQRHTDAANRRETVYLLSNEGRRVAGLLPPACSSTVAFHLRE